MIATRPAAPRRPAHLLRLAALLSLGAACLAASSAAAATAATLEEGIALKNQQKLAEAAVVFAELVRAQPRDTKALEQLAIVQGWLGQHDAALASWGALVALEPQTVYFQVGRARVRYWKGELQLAREGLEAVLRKSPADADALLLAGDVALAQRDYDAARGFYLRAQALAPADASIEGRLGRAQTPARFRLDVGGEFDGFSRYDDAHLSGRGSEGGWFGQLGFKATDSLTVGAGFEELRWFGFTDHRVNLVADLLATPDLLLSGRAALTPSNHFLAAWELGAGAELRVAQPWTALFAVKHLSYTGNEVTLIQPGARLETGQFSAQLQGIIALSSNGDPAGAGILRFGWAFSDAVAAWLGGSYGKEALSTPLGTSFALVTAAFTGLSWSISSGFGVRIDLGYERRQDAHQKVSAALGLTFKL